MTQSSSTHFNDDMKYLMSDSIIPIHVSLWIKSIQKNPLLLARLLKLDVESVKESLALLERMGLIQLDNKTSEVLKIENRRTHFGKEHPLTRTHQLLMKTAMNQKSFSFPEEQKENFFITFTTDKNGFEKIKIEIKNFISSVQNISFSGEHTGTYQMNLDLLELFRV